jgi:ABC-2 type transport system permease protein
MRAIKAIFIRNLTNFIRDRTRFIFTILMAVFFLFIFSFAMKSAAIGIANPINYLISGIIIMSVFQTALNNSMNIIEDISSGFMREILVSPISRWQISIGQVLSSSAIAVLQGLIIVIVGLFMGLQTDPVHFLEMIGVMILVGVTFSSIGLFLATLAKSSATFQVIVTVLVLPLTLLSGALIPTTTMPSFLLPLVYLNPMTYTTSIFRYISLRMEGLSAAQLIKAGVAFDIYGFTALPYFSLILIVVIGMLFLFFCVSRFNRADFSTVKVFRPRR